MSDYVRRGKPRRQPQSNNRPQNFWTHPNEFPRNPCVLHMFFRVSRFFFHMTFNFGVNKQYLLMIFYLPQFGTHSFDNIKKYVHRVVH